jgi:hypothetical protein
MQVVVLGVSAALVGPGFWRAIDHSERSGRFEVTVEHMDGPFEALSLEGGIATGSLLPKVRPGSHVLWVLRLSAPWPAALDLDTRLVRQQDEAAIAWSHRQLGKLGPESHTYLVDQPLPVDLKAGRYQIVMDVSLHDLSSAHWLLPSLSIDIAAAAGS